jgi:thiol-disulfide isomerase/thioredoxin
MIGYTGTAPERANWQVLWIKDGKVHRKHCGHDLMEAIRIHDLAKNADRKGVTLRCCNFGFPPPEKYLPHEVKVKVPLDPPKIVKIKGKRYKKTFEVVTAVKNPMREMNKKGIWWCPYCQKMRKFVYHSLSVNQHLGNVQKFRDPAYRCPMCKIPHRDLTVRKYNPMAIQLVYELEQKATRAPKKDRRKEFAKKKKRRKKEVDE